MGKRAEMNQQKQVVVKRSATVALVLPVPSLCRQNRVIARRVFQAGLCRAAVSWRGHRRHFICFLGAKAALPRLELRPA